MLPYRPDSELSCVFDNGTEQQPLLSPLLCASSEELEGFVIAAACVIFILGIDWRKILSFEVDTSR